MEPLRTTFALACALIGLACAGRATAGAQAARSPTPAAARPAPPPPLAPLTSQRVVVFPLQVVRSAEAAAVGWLADAAAAERFRVTVDDELAFALGERGLDSAWVMSRDVIRSAARNPALAPDPRTLPVGELLGGVRRAAPDLQGALGAQIRSLVALHDARIAFVPVEVRFERAGAGGAARAVLRLALIDARTSQVRWSADVTGDTVPTFSRAIAAGLAGRAADLVKSP